MHYVSRLIPSINDIHYVSLLNYTGKLGSLYIKKSVFIYITMASTMFIIDPH